MIRVFSMSYDVTNIFNRMAAMLEIQTRYVTCPILWAEQKLDFPKDVLALASKLPTVYHLASQAFIDGKWIFVDATYDLPLEKIGAHVTRSWDGVDAMPFGN